MKRKMIGGLVLAAILCMLSVFAAADGIQVMDTEGNETTLESYIDGHDSIILYGRTICGNCNSFLKGIKTSLQTLSDHGIRVIAVEENNAQVQTAAALKEYADNYPGITVLRDNGNANNSFWRWLFSFDSFDSSGSITLPMLFIRDAGGNLLDYSTGYVEDTSQFAAHAIELLTGAKPGPEPESGGLIGNITAAYVTEPYTRLPLNKLITWDVIVEGVSIDDLTVTYELLFCKDDTDDRIYTVIKSGDVKNGSFTLSISEEGRYLVRLNLTDRKGDSVRIEQNYYLSEGVNGDALSRKIKEIVDACKASGAADSKKIAGFLHDYLIDHAEYDINAQHKYDPEGVLLYGRGVCQ
ncbi:MAG: hypothetical protein ABTB30_17105, partial [Clostridia bacterium]